LKLRKKSDSVKKTRASRGNKGVEKGVFRKGASVGAEGG